MRWFLDTEFAENGETIKLISIALVSEHGHYYYRALSDGWKRDDCSEWVKQNVLPHVEALAPWDWVSRAQAAADIRHKLLTQGDGKPEIWGYFSDYDWVALCQLFGTMMELPEGFPMFCLDLKQEMHLRGITKDMIPPQDGAAHNALDDAWWICKAWKAMQAMKAGEP